LHVGCEARNGAVAALSGLAMKGIGPCLIYKIPGGRHHRIVVIRLGWQMEEAMAWTTPTLVEICVGLEINAYLPAEL
jgi:coenzyme PQQ precursor peptide PqqA